MRAQSTTMTNPLSLIRRILQPRPKSSWVVYKKHTQIDPSVILTPQAVLKIFHPEAAEGICLEIGPGSHIYSCFNILKPGARIKVGKNCQLGNVIFTAADSIEVGDDVLMAWGITILDSDTHSLFWEERRHDVGLSRTDYEQTKGWDIGRSHNWDQIRSEKIVIGSKSWIGFNTIILKGVTIGEGAIIGAGSVVTRDIPAWHIAAGNPCTIIRKISPTRDASVISNGPA